MQQQTKVTFFPQSGVNGANVITFMDRNSFIFGLFATNEGNTMLMRLSQAKVTIYGFTSQPVVSTIPSG
jgi:hypothetical protein